MWPKVATKQGQDHNVKVNSIRFYPTAPEGELCQ